MSESRSAAASLSAAPPHELRLPALEVRQGPDRRFFTFAVDGKLLASFAAVSRVRRPDGAGIEGYQRPEVLSHVRAIRKYMESDDALVPNALVVAFDGRVCFEPAANEGPDYVRVGTLVIPVDPDWADEEKPGWLVDGQQRCAAVRDARVASFPVAVSGFVTESVEVQRQQFILVNATKPLPRGLVHELLPSTPGELPPTLRKHRFPAYLLERLNHDQESPLRGRICTPTTPEGVIKDNSVLRVIEGSLTDGALYPYRDPATGEGDAEAMLRLLKAYWAAVAAVFADAWDLPPRRSRLTHGAGIVALGLVMDALAERCPDPSVDDFARPLTRLRPSCRWTSGTWTFPHGVRRRWNELQNVGRDTRLLADHLVSLVLQATGSSPPDPSQLNQGGIDMPDQHGAPTVGDLIDYLGQLPPDIGVYLDDEAFGESDATGDYVSLSFALSELAAV